MSSTCSHNMANFGLLTAEICWRVWGTPANFNGFRVLAALLHGTLSRRQPNCGVEQTAPPVVGRATITLGIDPHSSYILERSQLRPHYPSPRPCSPCEARALVPISVCFWLPDSVACVNHAQPLGMHRAPTSINVRVCYLGHMCMCKHMHICLYINTHSL